MLPQAHEEKVGSVIGVLLNIGQRFGYITVQQRIYVVPAHDITRDRSFEYTSDLNCVLLGGFVDELLDVGRFRSCAE
jgi:hypothetical protein